MVRDQDVIRDLLLAIEKDGPAADQFTLRNADFPELEGEELFGHIELLEDAMFIKPAQQFLGVSGAVEVGSLTWKGHEYLDSIRDPEIWKKTKDIANQSKAAGFDLIKQIALGVAKAQIKLHTGMEI